MSYVIGKTKMPIGIYEYNPQMKKVHISEYIPEILALETEEYEKLSADYKIFREFINDLRKNIVNDEILRILLPGALCQTGWDQG